MNTSRLHRKKSTNGSGTKAQVAPDLDAPGAAGMRTSRAAAVLRHGMSAARRGVAGLLDRVPGTVRATQSAARGTVDALQTLPDSTLQSLAATSAGLGIGLSFTRARRLAFVVGMVPAVLVQLAIARRPVEPRIPADAGA